MRFTTASFVLFAAVSVCGSSAFAQDGVRDTLTPPPARAPEALVTKSVQDLARGAVGSAVKDDVKALRSGPLLMHGNYCGIGNRPGKAPVDALDAACMRHDACTKTGAMPSCGCDDRLRVEASAIATDPATPADIKLIATATASAMAVLICKEAPRAASKPAAVVAPEN